MPHPRDPQIEKARLAQAHQHADEMLAAILRPEYPLVVVTHDDRLASRMERVYEIEKGRLSERVTQPSRRDEPYTAT